jgi:hypothetical protein
MPSKNDPVIFTPVFPSSLFDWFPDIKKGLTSVPKIVEFYQKRGSRRTPIDLNGQIKIESIETKKIIVGFAEGGAKDYTSYHIKEDDLMDDLMKGWFIFVMHNEERYQQEIDLLNERLTCGQSCRKVAKDQ